MQFLKEIGQRVVSADEFETILGHTIFDKMLDCVLDMYVTICGLNSFQSASNFFVVRQSRKGNYP